MKLTDQLGDRTAEFLELEYEASEPYMAFVYSTRDEGLAVNRFLLDKHAGEFAPPHGRLALDDAGNIVGMAAWLSGAALAQARLRATMALAQFPALRADPQIGQRMRLASSTLIKVDKGDYYLSRITVAPAHRGRGIGDELIAELRREARRAGAKQIVLEVASHLAGARRFYARNQFTECDCRRVADGHTGRTLEYVHMAQVLEPAENG